MRRKEGEKKRKQALDLLCKTAIPESELKFLFKQEAKGICKCEAAARSKCKQTPCVKVNNVSGKVN